MDRPSGVNLLVVWWSATGGTRMLVDALVDGARREAARADATPVCVRVLRADVAAAADVLSAAGLVFASPENLGGVAGMLKDFFDRSYYPVLDRIAGRPYATVVCAGSDGEGATRQIDRIAIGWRLRRVAPALIVRTGAQTSEAILAPKTISPPDLDRVRDLGGSIGAGLALGLF